VLNIIHSEGEVSPKIFERTANADSGNEIMMNDKFRQNYTDEVGECLISNEEHLSTDGLVSPITPSRKMVQ